MSRIGRERGSHIYRVEKGSGSEGTLTLYKYLHENSINEVRELITGSKAGRTRGTTVTTSEWREATGRSAGLPGKWLHSNATARDWRREEMEC